MKVVIQKVSSASVSIANEQHASIQRGLVVLLGITHADTLEDITWLSKKIVNLRIFADPAGLMNLSVKDVTGEVLLISQFTLHALTKKGNRPSFIESAPAEVSMPLYQKMIAALENELGKEIKTGQFGADMQVQLVNDGPVTIIMDSKDKK